MAVKGGHLLSECLDRPFPMGTNGNQWERFPSAHTSRPGFPTRARLRYGRCSGGKTKIWPRFKRLHLGAALDH